MEPQYELKFAPYPTSHVAKILEYFHISLQEYDSWWWWERRSGLDLEASGIIVQYHHMNICDCWIKEDHFFQNLDKINQLMVFMCVRPTCSCYIENKIN